METKKTIGDELRAERKHYGEQKAEKKVLNAELKADQKELAEAREVKPEVRDESKPQVATNKGPFFEADLELIQIAPSFVRYRVTNAKGYPVEGLSHLQISRRDEFDLPTFPIDADFNTDFMNQDLEAAEKIDIDRKRGPDVFKKMIEKQKRFRPFMKRKIVITVV